jgi:hypothetical protein
MQSAKCKVENGEWEELCPLGARRRMRWFATLHCYGAGSISRAPHGLADHAKEEGGHVEKCGEMRIIGHRCPKPPSRSSLFRMSADCESARRRAPDGHVRHFRLARRSRLFRKELRRHGFTVRRAENGKL